MRKSVFSTFWDHFVKRGRCWEWSLGLTTKGYGKVWAWGRAQQAHRVAYMLVHGLERLPADVCVCHKCDNPKCIRPTHLFLGSHLDNMRDANRKGRMVQHRGQNHGMAKLTQSKVRWIRKNYIKGSRRMGGPSLAKRLGVSQALISRIIRHENWIGI